MIKQIWKIMIVQKYYVDPGIRIRKCNMWIQDQNLSVSNKGFLNGPAVSHKEPGAADHSSVEWGCNV